MVYIDPETEKSRLAIENWGPPGWTFLHAITFSYPENPTQEEKKKYFAFFDAVAGVLPCKLCAKHFADAFAKNTQGPYSRIFNNKYNLSKWLVDVHNDVNRTNNKPIVSYEWAAYKYRTPGYERSYTKELPYIIIVVVCLLFVCSQMLSRAICSNSKSNFK